MASVLDKRTCLIFLDIDGVLNNSDIYPVIRAEQKLYPNVRHGELSLSQHLTAPSDCFDPGALKKLYNLIQEIRRFAEPKTVISSNWRKNQTVEELREVIFKKHKFAELIIDKTADYVLNKKGGIRQSGSEINRWLKNHKKPTGQNINLSPILGDNDDAIYRKFPDCFVKTEAEYLLSIEDVKEALKLLKKMVDEPTLEEMADAYNEMEFPK